ETAKESEAAESQEEEGNDASILEHSIEANNLTDEPQIANETEAVSVTANEAEKVPEDTISLEMPLDASIQVEIQSTAPELSNVCVLEEAEIAAVTETHVSPIPEDNKIDESVQMEATESLENTAEHHQTEQGRKNQEVDAETQDTEAKFLEEQMEVDGKETMGEVSLEDGTGEMGGNVENHLESKTHAEAVDDDQRQVDIEGCSQREREVELRHNDNSLCPQDTQDTDVILSYEKEYVIIKQEDMKKVSFNVCAPDVPRQMEDAEGFLSQAGVAEQAVHPWEMNYEYVQQDSQHELQTVDNEKSNDLMDTIEATTEQCSQKEQEVQTKVVIAVIKIQMPQAETCEQEVEITEDQSQIVEETQFEDTAATMTQDAAESNEEGGETVTKCLIGQELEADTTQKPREDSEQTTVTTTLEAVSEMAKPLDAQSQKCLSEEVISKDVEYGTIQEVVMKNKTTENSQPQTSGDREAVFFPVEAKEQASAIEDITDHLREDAEAIDLMAQIETVEATMEAIEELISKMEPNSELTAAS
ncbi:hypothetical protein SKAU_G00207520, partial [Synaphobranchus kaupii]